MTERYDDVEFLTGADDAAGEDDDVVEFGRRRVSGRVTTLAGLVIAASIVALLVARSDRHKPAARATPAPSSLTTQPGELSAPPGQGRALLLPSSPVVDGVLAAPRLYTLQFSQLTVTAPAGSRGVSPDGLDFDRIGGAARLLVDGPANRLWVVVLNTRDGQILEFDASTLRPLRRVSWPQPVAAAAVLLGTLYFSTPSGVASFGPAARTPVLVAALKGHSGAVVADPLRARLLVLDYATRSRLRAYRPGGALSAVVGEMGFANGSVVVTGDGRIWGGGSGPSGAVLSRLDAATLQPGRPSPQVSRLGPDVVLVAAGNSDIWVRTAAVAPALFCVNGETGVEHQRWSDAPGRVTSQDGEAYLASGTTVRPLIMTACAG